MDITRSWVMSWVIAPIKNMFVNWPWGTIISIFSAAIVFVFLVLVVSILYMTVNSCFLPKKRNKGRAIRKTYIPASVEIDLELSAADTAYLPPYSTLFPAEYSVEVELKGQRSSIVVSQKLFDELSSGDEVTVEYCWTRISNRFCPKKLFTV